MVSAVISGIAAGMGVLVSPDHLRLWGNLAGHLGGGFWLAVVGSVVVYAWSAGSYRRLATASADNSGYLTSLRLRFGYAGVALALASRLSLTAGLSTGILVTAGFVFNETFVYWFPNFGFAFICLAIAALVHLGGYGLAQNVQAAFVTLAILGLLILIVAGFWRPGPPPSSGPIPSPGFGLSALLGSLLLFVGFDFGAARKTSAAGPSIGLAAMTAALVSSAIVLGLWSTVSLEHVSPGRLADSFIPYSLAARRIGGQLGRYLIGIVVIAGTLSAVITLFSVTARMMTELARLAMLPRCCQGSGHRNLTAVFLLAAVVAVMMATGVAGAPELEVFIRAAFILWLLHLTAIHLAALASGTTKPDRLPMGQPARRIWTTLPAAAAMGTGAVCLWAMDAERLLLSGFILATWLGVTAALYLIHKAKIGTKPPVT
jgi:amino acid transporter